MYSYAGTLLCAATVRNSGHVRISDVIVAGDSNNCSQAVLLPDQTADCFVWKTLIREDFTADTFTVAFTDLSGTPAGAVALLSTVPGGSVTVANPNKFVALLSVSVDANTTSVARAGESVLYIVKLVSVGLSLSHRTLVALASAPRVLALWRSKNSCFMFRNLHAHAIGKERRPAA
jgi:hypothetical protein